MADICITVPKTIKWEDYKKELENIAPYKYRKYVLPIDAIANKQVDEYERITGKRLTLLSIKFNLSK